MEKFGTKQHDYTVAYLPFRVVPYKPFMLFCIYLWQSIKHNVSYRFNRTVSRRSLNVKILHTNSTVSHWTHRIVSHHTVSYCIASYFIYHIVKCRTTVTFSYRAVLTASKRILSYRIILAPYSSVVYIAVRNGKHGAILYDMLR